VPVLYSPPPRSATIRTTLGSTCATSKSARALPAAASAHNTTALNINCGNRGNRDNPNPVQSLQEERRVPVGDGIVSTVKLAESLVAPGLRASKTAACAEPRQKTYTGAVAGYAPDAGTSP